jgi:hypothetical protein
MNRSDSPFRPTPRMLRQFAGAWLAVCLGVALHQWLARHQPVHAAIWGGMGIGVGGLGLWKPGWIRWLYLAAMAAAYPIGWTVSLVVLAFMFYGVITPLALWFRWRGRDALQRRPAPGAASYWHRREPSVDPARYLKQY